MKCENLTNHITFIGAERKVENMSAVLELGNFEYNR